jgi:hypothetical protein
MTNTFQGGKGKYLSITMSEPTKKGSFNFFNEGENRSKTLAACLRQCRI